MQGYVCVNGESEYQHSCCDFEQRRMRMNIYDVILKRHNGCTRKDVCVFYDEDKTLALNKMAEYVKKNGFSIIEKDGCFTIATVILRERKPTGEVISEIPYHKLFNTVTAKLLTSVSKGE